MKVFKKLLIFLLLAFINIGMVNAATIKETTNAGDTFDTIQNGDIIIGITKFTQGTTITGLRAAKAGADFGSFQSKNNLNDDLTILVNAGSGGWYQMDETGGVKKVTLEDDLFVYYVNNTEKKVTVPYTDATVNTNALPTGITYNNGEFLVPATRLNFSIQTTDGAYVDFSSTPYSETTAYQDELRGHTISYRIYGNEIHKDTVLLGSTTVEPEDPTLGTNTFVNWIDSSTGESFTFGGEINENIVLNAKFTGNSTITINNQNETPTYNITNVLDNVAFKYNATTVRELLLTPTKVGHVLSKWCTDAACLNEFNLNTTSVTNSMTIYAGYNEIEYNILFDYFEDGPKVSYNDEVDLTDYQNVVKTGYTFAGWDTDSSADTVVYEKNDKVSQLSATNNATVNLYAVYTPITYSVAFNANDGTNAPSSITLTYDMDKSLSSVTEPEREGYVFTGWAKTNNATTANFTTEINENLTTTANAEITLYAVWVADTDTEYKVEDYLESLDGSYSSVGSQTFTGTTLTNALSSVRTTTYTGFTYDEENTNNVSSGAISADGTLVLKRYFKRNTYSINFMDGDDLIRAVSYKYGAATSALDPIPTKTGYDFKNWLDGSSNAYTFTTMPASNLTLSAAWYQKPVTATLSKTHKQTTTSGWEYYINLSTSDYDGVEYYVEDTDGDITIDEKQYSTLTLSTNLTGNYLLVAPNSEKNIIARTYKDYDGVKVYSSYTNIVNITTPITYTITFNKNAIDETITNMPTSIYKAVDINWEFENLPTRVGYTFEGWSYDSTASVGFNKTGGFGQDYPGATQGSTYTVYAIWRVKTYTITFDANGGNTTSLPENQTKTHGTNLILTNDTPTKEGYDFVSWNTETNGSGTTYLKGATYEVEADDTLYAVWSAKTYTITFDANGENVLSLPDNQTKTHGTNLILTNDTPTREGYNFVSWNTEADGSSTTYLKGATYEVEANDTLYAVWSTKTYTITFDANGGDAASLPENQTKTHGTDLIITNDTPTKEGYNFVSWNTEANGSGTTYLKGATYEAEADDTLYAVWSAKTYTITFDANGGDAASLPENQTKTHGTDLIITNDTPTKEGYNFVSWNTEANGSGTTYLKSATYEVEAADTLYATWAIKTYSIVYKKDMNDGNGYVTYETDEKEHNATYTISNETPTVITGYEFIRFDTSENGNGTEYELGDTYELNQDLTIYVIQNPISYDIIYNLDSGTNGENPANYTVNDATFTLAEPTKTGYNFTGWTGTNGNTPSKTVTITKGSTGNKEYTANWEEVTYTINFSDGVDEEEISVPASLTKTYGTNANITGNPEREGYDFEGWAISLETEPLYTTIIDSDLANTQDATVNLIAIWSLKSYQLTYSLGGGSFPVANPESIENINPATYQKGSDSNTMIFVKNPVREGYNFTGWTCTGVTDPDLNLASITPLTRSLTITTVGNKTLVANWEKSTVTIHYQKDAVEVTGSVNNTTSLYGENMTLATNSFEKTGYTFKGWTTTIGGSQEYTAGQTLVFPVTENDRLTMYTDYSVTLYPVWEVAKYDVVYKKTDGTVIDTVSKTHDTALTLFDAEDLTVPGGYSFSKWNTASNGLGTDYEGGTSYTGNADLTLYAINTPIPYEITYDWETEYGLNTNIVSYNIESAEYTLTNPEKEGYDFDGWTGSNGEIPQTTVIIPQGSTGNKHYTPNWTAKTYILTYEYNLATGGNVDVFKNVTYKGTYGDLPSPTKEGYTFVKWQAGQYVESNFVSEYDVTSETVVDIASDHRLYAVWSPNELSVKLHDNNGGEDTVYSKTCYIGEPCSLNYNEFAKRGYSLLGWSSDSSSTTATYQLIDTPSDLVGDEDGNVNLYAIWQANTYYIHYDANGGSGSAMQTTTCTYDTDCELRTNTYTYIYKHFDGWATAPTGITRYSDGVWVANLVESGNITLYAKYEDNDYTIIFNKNNDLATGLMDNMTVTNTNNETLPISNFENVGYDFTYWTTKADGTGDVYHDGESVVLGNDLIINLYAQWQPKELTIRTYGSKYMQRCHMEGDIEVCDEDELGDPIYEYVLLEENYASDIYYNQDISSMYFEQYKYYPGHKFEGWYYATVTHQDDGFGNITDIYTYGNEFVLGTCTLPTYKDESSCTQNSGTWTPAKHQANNILIAAKYTAINYTIRLYNNTSSSDTSYTDITTYDGTNPIIFDSEVVLPNPTKENAELVGWDIFDSASASEEITLPLPGCPDENPTCDRRAHLHLSDTTVTPDENNVISLYAVWSAIQPPQEPEISFQGYGKMCETEWNQETQSSYCKTDNLGNIVYIDPPYYVQSHKSVPYNTFTLALLEDTDFVNQNTMKPGYTFASWNEIVEYYSCDSDGDDFYCVNHDKISKTPYEFSKCSLDDATNTYNQTECLEASGNWELKDIDNSVDLVAIFTPLSYTINFNLNGASGTTPNSVLNAEAGSKITLPSIEEITAPANATFKGWSFVDNDCQEGYSCYVPLEGVMEIDELDVSQATIDNQTVTMYAIWEYSVYNMYWDPNDGILRSNELLADLGLYTQITTNTASTTLTAEYLKDEFGGSFVPESKRLLGWAMEPDGVVVYGPGMVIDAGAVGTSYVLNQKVYAVYTDLSINIEYNLNGGTESLTSGSSSATYDELFTLPGAPTKSGYSFVGWRIVEFYEESGNQPLLAAGSTKLYDFDIYEEVMTIDAIFVPDWYNASTTSYTIDTQTELNDLAIALELINQVASAVNPITITITNDSDGEPLQLTNSLSVDENVTLIIDSNSSLNILNTGMNQNGSINVRGTIKVYLDSNNVFNFIGNIYINHGAKMLVNDTFEYIGANGSFIPAEQSNVDIRVSNTDMQISINGNVTLDDDNYFNSDFEDGYFIIGSREMLNVSSGSTLTINNNVKLYGNIVGNGTLVINDLDSGGSAKTLFRGNMSYIDSQLNISAESLQEIEDEPASTGVTLKYYPNYDSLNSISQEPILTNTTYTITSIIPVREGYTFVGWSETSDGAVEYLSSQSYDNFAANCVGAEYNLYAVWVGTWYDGTNNYNLTEQNMGELNKAMPYIKALQNSVTITFANDVTLSANLEVPSNVTLKAPKLNTGLFSTTVEGTLIVGIENGNPAITGNAIIFIDGGNFKTYENETTQVLVGTGGAIVATSIASELGLRMTIDGLYYDLRNGTFETGIDNYSYATLDVSPESSITIKNDVEINTSLICPGTININSGKTLTVKLGASTNVTGTINHDGDYGTYDVEVE